MPSKAEIIAYVILALTLGGAGAFIASAKKAEGIAIGEKNVSVACEQGKTNAVKNIAKDLANRPHTDDDVSRRLREWAERARERENNAK